MKKLYLYMTLLLCNVALLNILLSLDLAGVIWISLTCCFLASIISDIFLLFRSKPINLAFLSFKFFYLILILLEPSLSLMVHGEFSYVLQFGYYPRDAVNVVLLFHTIFAMLLILFDNHKHTQIGFIAPKISIRNVLILFVFNAIGLYPYFRDGINGFILLILQGRSIENSQFANSGLGNSDLYIHLSTVLIAVSCLYGYFLIAVKRRRTRTTIIFLLLFLLNVFIVASSGTRTRVLFILLPLSIFYIYTVVIGYRSFSARLAVIGIVSALLLFSAMVQFRTTGYSDLQTEGDIALDFSGINLNNEFVYIVENFPRPVNERNLLQCLIYPLPEQIWKFLINPVPRIIYKEKYVDPSFAKFNQQRIGYTGQDELFNITPTIFGRFYLLYGYVGLMYIPTFLILPLLILNKRMSSGTLSTHSILINTMMITFLCQSLRDLSPGWMYSTLISIFIVRLFD